MPIDPATQAKLFHEADARFAAQTGITHKLDPKAWIDQPFIPAWTDIYNKVVREYQAGVLAWTHEDPFVQTSLEAASMLADKSAGHLHDGMSTTDPAEVAAHLKASQDAHAASQAASRQAASAQPPTVSPGLVAQGTDLVNRAIAGGGRAIGGAIDAIGAMQSAAAPGMALGVHTPGDPNPLHFTMQGGQQDMGGGGPGGGGPGAAAKHGGLGLALGVAGGAIGLGLLVVGMSGKRTRARSSAGRTLVIRRDRIYGGPR